MSHGQVRAADLPFTRFRHLSDPISITSVATELDEIGELSKGVYYKSNQKLSLVKEYAGWLAATDNPSPAGRAGSHISFLGTGKVQVEYEVTLHRLRLRLLETVVRERHGPDAVRIIRVLLDHGKMDEKHVSFFGGFKDVCCLGGAAS
jgi:DNA-directed RNA polymerase III subunit RPC3